MEVTILNYMKQLSRVAGKPEEMEVFAEFKTELDSHLQNGTDQIMLEFFNYPVWISSKLKGISFGEAAQLEYRHLVEG